MIITVECPDCHTTFPVDPRKVPEGGVKVRCSACSGIFFVAKPEMPAPVAAPPAFVPSGGGTPEAHTPSGSTVPQAGDDAEPPEQDEPHAAVESAVSDGPDEADGAVEDDRDNVDPWSGAGWDDPADMGAPHAESADPWSGGMGLHDDSGDAGSGPSDWVVEQSSPVELDEPKAPVERLETIEEETRSAAEAHDAGRDGELDPGEWDEEAVPPAAEAPVGGVTDEPAPFEAEVDEVHEVHADDDAFEDVAETSEAADAMAEAAEEVAATVEAEVAEAHAAEAAEEGAATLEDEVDAGAPGTVADTEEAAATPEAEVDEEAPDAATTEARPSGFQFGKRDPHEKARRLARVLVSDMITYNPERHQRALEQGTLHADFEEEIRKSWAEYTDQVGRELAESTSYWFDALNEILARGEKVF